MNKCATCGTPFKDGSIPMCRCGLDVAATSSPERDGDPCPSLNDDITALIGVRWHQEDGPPCSYFEYRRRQGADVRVHYVIWSCAGLTMPGHHRISVERPDIFIAWLVDALGGYAKAHGASPETHKLMWRARPEFLKGSDGRYKFYCRLEFMPKDAWVLEMEAA